jgi:hypothetical protein
MHIFLKKDRKKEVEETLRVIFDFRRKAFFCEDLIKLCTSLMPKPLRGNKL